MTNQHGDPVLVETADAVATVTLNRPDTLNAFDLQMNKDFHTTMWRLDADESVRAIVLTGAGRGFCSGADLRGGDGAHAFDRAAQAEHDAELDVDPERMPERWGYWRMRTPVVVAINGAAVGAGLSIAMLFDVRFVAQDAKLGFIFTRRGMVPDANISWLLPRIVGPQRALDLLLTGRMFSGSDAAEYGLALEALPTAEVLPAAQAYARELAIATAPASAAITKALVYRSLEMGDRARAMTMETRTIWWAGAQPDATEGVESFFDRRPPVWRSRKNVALPEPIWSA